LAQPTILTIPSTDLAFHAQVRRLAAAVAGEDPEALEARLRVLFPRAVVRRRDIVGEPTAWYVYRDGAWRADLTGPWWEQPGLPRAEVSADGWITEANATALDLLGIDAAERGARHFTDFVAPGTLADSLSMFEIVSEGHPLTATVVLRPTSGDLIAVDIHAWREDDRLIALWRLAEDIAVTAGSSPEPSPVSVACVPGTDAAFRGYVDLALERMPEPTIAGLELRLRRLYPHARVELDGDGWIARRDATADTTSDRWWEDPELPRVRYDAQALIVEANRAAEELLGRSMIGHYWQEFVTPGSTEEVSAMLAILADVGQAESRFRMPRADGSLLEFDSWTEVNGEGYTTVMRPTRAAS
jgi:PAS domain-containing protein